MVIRLSSPRRPSRTFRRDFEPAKLTRYWVRMSSQRSLRLRSPERTLSFTVKATSNAKRDSDAKPRDSQKDEVLREWRESAFYWQKHASTIRTMFGPITQALIEGAGIIGGDAVLDVAGGAGEPSLTIAETVGPTGSVTCTDVTPEMVTAAQNEAQQRKLTNVVFSQCAADCLPFESKLFDAVVSRLGIMFFPDTLA